MAEEIAATDDVIIMMSGRLLKIWTSDVWMLENITRIMQVVKALGGYNHALPDHRCEGGGGVRSDSDLPSWRLDDPDTVRHADRRRNPWYPHDLRSTHDNVRSLQLDLILS